MPADITLEEVWKLFRETDQKFRETDDKLDRLDAIVARTSRSVDDLTGKWGKFLEDLVAPACFSRKPGRPDWRAGQAGVSGRGERGS